MHSLKMIISQRLVIIKRGFCNCLYHFEKNSFRFLSRNAKRFPAQKKITIKNSFAYKDECYSSMEKNEDNKTEEIQTIKWLPSPLVVAGSNGGRKLERSTFSRKQNQPILKYKGEIVFGVHPVYLAMLKRNRTLYQLFIRKECVASEIGNTEHRKKIIQLAEEMNVPINVVDNKGLKYLAPDAVHQGVCLDAGALPLLNWKNMPECQELEMPLWIILHEIKDPMNVGAIIRSAYYFGVAKLFITRGNSCKLSPTVSKASAGCLEVVDIYQIENVEDFIQSKKNSGWNVISALTYESKGTQSVMDVSKFRLTKPTILILGNEGEGIPPSVQKLCDMFVSVCPKQILHQGIDSLNVSVAAGVILHSLMQFSGVSR